jgi:hypothetical protein
VYCTKKITQKFFIVDFCKTDYFLVYRRNEFSSLVTGEFSQIICISVLLPKIVFEIFAMANKIVFNQKINEKEDKNKIILWRLFNV